MRSARIVSLSACVLAAAGCSTSQAARTDRETGTATKPVPARTAARGDLRSASAAKGDPRIRVLGKPIVYRGSKRGNTLGSDTYTVLFRTSRSFVGRYGAGGSVKPGTIGLGSAEDNHDGFSSINGVTKHCYAWSLTRRRGAHDPRVGSIALLRLNLNGAPSRMIHVRIRAFPTIRNVQFYGPNSNVSSVYVRGQISRDLRSIKCVSRF